MQLCITHTDIENISTFRACAEQYNAVYKLLHIQCNTVVTMLLPHTMPAKQPQHGKAALTCAVEFDVLSYFRLDSRCDGDFLRPNTDELTSV